MTARYSKNGDSSPNRRRYLALWFPFLPTDRLRLTQAQSRSGTPSEAPLALVEKVNGALRIAALDAAALGVGLRVGFTLADARARIPDLDLAEADPASDRDFLERLAAACERYTPLVALDTPDGLCLDITGCAHLFGGERALRVQACERLGILGLKVRACIAGTPDAARALARFSAHEWVAPGEEESLAGALPVAALGTDAETALALTRAGLKTLADLDERPSAILSARFGQGISARLQRTLGREDVRITPLRPPPECIAERRFPTPLLDTINIEAALGLLLEEAALLLEPRGLGGRVFEASFFRTDNVVRSIRIETGRPTRDVTALARLYHERLDSLADPIDPGFGFDVVRLAVLSAEPYEAQEPNFDSQALSDLALSDLVDRLSARFGRARVSRLLACDTHIPERATRRVAALEPADPDPWPEAEPSEPPLRPLQLFDPPQSIDALAEVPDGPPLRFRWRRVLHEVARAEGPERIAPEWWRDGSQEPTRDYYRIEDSQGRRFWVFRQGLYGERTEAPRWFLHGLFA